MQSTITPKIPVKSTREIKKLNRKTLEMSKKSVRWAFNFAEWSPSEKDFKFAISCLQFDEKDKLQKFIFKKDVKASLIGRLLIKKFINECTKIPYKEIELITDKNTGRPLLKNSSSIPVNFNVSHQGNYTVLAGELRDLKIGVDVMKLEYSGGKTISEFFRIMNRNFTDSEWKEIRGDGRRKECEQIAMFCRHWALKESYVKALSVGITGDLRELDFRTNSDLSLGGIVRDTVLHEKGVQRNWVFEESMIDHDHCIAVALEVEKNGFYHDDNHFEKLKFEDLVQSALPRYLEDEGYCQEYFKKCEKP